MKLAVTTKAHPTTPVHTHRLLRARVFTLTVQPLPGQETPAVPVLSGTSGALGLEAASMEQCCRTSTAPVPVRPRELFPGLGSRAQAPEPWVPCLV